MLVFGKLFSYIDSISLPALKWQSSSDSFVTGINLLLLLVVPDDFANQFIFPGQRISSPPFLIFVI